MTQEALIPAHVRFIEGDPPSASGGVSRFDHQAIAATLRERPGVWALLPDLPAGCVGSIRSGALAAYRPSGTYAAQTVDGQVWARYVGNA